MVISGGLVTGGVIACVFIALTIGEYVVLFFVPTMLVFVLIFLPTYTICKKKAEKKRNLENKPKFYNECISNGITKCQSEKEIQKAKLIAEKYNLKYNDIAKLFQEAKEQVNEEKDEEERTAREAEIKAQKEKETISRDALTKYAQYSGREKRIAMLTDKWKEASDSAKSMRKLGSMVTNASFQKEHDSAVLGGLATGIAGTAAGVATALNTEAKNARIRAQNEANYRANSSIINNSYSAARKYSEMADELQAEIEKAKVKLVSEDSAAECLGYLRFTKAGVSVSDLGSCTITTTAKLKTALKIFDDVDAVVDGTVKAEIYDEDNRIGTASLVLPEYGIGKDAVELKGMCLFCGEQGKKYTVKYAADNLWAMER